MIKSTYYQDLTRMNTFRMRVKAKCFVEYDSVADLVDIEFDELSCPILHIGSGSNLLFTEDFKGTVLHSRINFIEILDECRSDDVLVSVGAGVLFDDFCDWAAKENLWGIENLSYIPGEVGASAVQNIGAYGVEVKDVIHRVYCYDTLEEEFISFGVDECEYGYRDSIFKRPEVKGRYIVTHVVFALSREPRPVLDYGHLKDAVMAVAGGGISLDGPAEGISEQVTPAMIRKVIIRIRKEKLPEPSVMGSAGSFFKNPVIAMEHFKRIESAAQAEHGADYRVPHYDMPDGTVKVPAAWMIEQCGWKGRRSGGAAVYEKQPLVIVNYTGEAYPEEIIGLERRIVASIKEKFGVELHPEVDHI
jgi:UDP-N-acetylmuramate dehydrogenase